MKFSWLTLALTTLTVACGDTPLEKELDEQTNSLRLYNPPSPTEPMYHRVPPGFTVLENGSGWILYSKPNSPPQGTDYVLVTGLNQTALQSVWGAVKDPWPGKGQYGGPDPLFKRQGLSDFIDQAPSHTVALVSGAFFNPANDPTQIAFGIKDGGVVTTDGADPAPVKKLMLETEGNQAFIRPFDLSTFTKHDLKPVNIFVGLDPTEPKTPTEVVGRIFLGTEVRSPGRGAVDTQILFIFSSAGSTQAHADETLRDFGTEHRIMFGGGSTAKAYVNGTTRTETNAARLIPHMFALRSR